MKRTLRKYKTIIKYRLSNNKTKPIHLVILSCVIILFSFGFAFLATGVGINGVATYTVPSTLDLASNLEFRTSSYLTNIKTITFNNTISTPSSPVATWDVSNNSDNTVVAYILTNSSDSTKYDLYIESDGNISPNANSSSLFSGMTSLTTITNLSYLDSSDITNMSSMFADCTSLSSLDLTEFDASSATNMSNMFNNVTCTITIPDTTGLLANTTTTYYGSSSSVYVTGTFTIKESFNSFINRSKAGNVSSSDVGTTFTVDLGDTYGEHTLRVANVSTPTECSGGDFSQTACGVVLEFSDIITEHAMNPSGTYKETYYEYGWNVDGWPASEMRTFVNNDIYNALPTNLKNAIIDTTVISGHGDTSGELNFTSTDKLYLLSAHEICIDGSSSMISSYDSSYNNTRQLDYYENNNVTHDDFSETIVKQYNKSNDFWWLRSAYLSDPDVRKFLVVESDGYCDMTPSINTNGVSPAFRIQYNQPDYESDGSDLGDFIETAKAGNATSDDVGTTFTVNLGSTYGNHTLRVANVSSPTECTGGDYSQTACGVVLEFADIIIDHVINSTDTNVGGWPASSMRTFVNDDIYNSLPTNLKNAIIDTTVVSGHGSTVGETNFTSTDKIYLLSGYEIYSDEAYYYMINHDTSNNSTRQLDYYADNIGQYESSAAIKQKEGSNSSWWLRSVDSNYIHYCLFVDSYGGMGDSNATSTRGVSPAFRVA